MPSERGGGPEAEEAARTQLLEVAWELEAIRYRLLGVRASLPAPEVSRFRDQEDEDEMDPQSEIRAVVDCVLEDWLEPAIRDLRRLAAREGD
ncbi:MAG TPA: hypothetical protein VMW27_06090 [Thermoanaerobaculia bacterium]|nr:hypothetical protein [Thermoanaerobaculia bacterium]